MQIQTINIQQFLGINQATLELGNINIVTGANGAGKSTVADAIRMAITGEPVRVQFKKDMAQLLHQGSPRGHIRITTTDGNSIARDVGSARIIGKGQVQVDDHLMRALDATRFTHARPKERRDILTDILTLNFNKDQIREAIETVVKINQSVESLIEMAAEGAWDEVEQRLKSNVSYLRRQWQDITGERYGSQKADAWAQTAPKPDIETEDLEQKVAGLKQQAEHLSHEITRIKTVREQQSQQKAQIMAQIESAKIRLKEIGGIENMDHVMECLKVEIQKLKQRDDGLVQKALDLKARHGELKSDLNAAKQVLQCPCCNEAVRIVNGKLVKAETPDMSKLRQQLDALDEQMTKIQEEHQSVVNRCNQLQTELRDKMMIQTKAQNLNEQLQTLRSTLDKLNQNENEAETGSLEQELRQVSEELEEKQEQLQNLKVQWQAWETAQENTCNALKVHRQIMLSEKLANLFGANGVRQTLVARALQPLNNALIEMATIAGWGEIIIDGDMELYLNGRPFGLLSKSEQWRVNLCVSKALCDLTESGLFLIDEANILDIRNRSGFLDLMKHFANQNTQVIAMATGKPEWFDVPGIHLFHADGKSITQYQVKQKAA